MACNTLVLVIIALGVSVLTLYSMLKIWNYAYLSKTAHNKTYTFKLKNYYGLIAPIVFLTVIILGFSLFPQLVYDYCTFTANQLFNSQAYIHAVLGVSV